jgi:hypothetical protein
VHGSPPMSPGPEKVSNPSFSVTEASRPRGLSRLSTSNDQTTLERVWGPLFDKDGHPTPRLGQLLRGIAVHLVRRCLMLESVFDLAFLTPNVL